MEGQGVVLQQTVLPQLPRNSKGKKKKDKAKPSKLVSIYDNKSLGHVLNGARAAPGLFGEASDSSDSELDLSVSAEELKVLDNFSCSTCEVAFKDLGEQRIHFKLDWHRYNLKAKANLLPNNSELLTEDQFEAMVSKDNHDEDAISLSGSESSSSQASQSGHEPEATLSDDETDVTSTPRHRHPKFFFRNHENEVFSVYKSLLGTKLQQEDSLVENLKVVREKARRIAVFMLGGGHFAGAVFDGNQTAVHKTFHCYTVRAKQGGSQFSNDNKTGGKAKSAGASLRRYNEMALIQHVQDIVRLWKEELATCDIIFFRAASGNRQVLFGGKEPPLDRKDPRLRSIPFPTKRATFAEVKRVHETLTSIETCGKYGDVEVNVSNKPAASKKTKKIVNRQIRRSKSREPVERPLPELVQELAVKAPSSDSDDNLRNEDDDAVILNRGQHPAEEKPRRKLKSAKKEKQDIVKIEDPVADLEVRLVTAARSGNTKTLREALADENISKIPGLDEGMEPVNARFGKSRQTLLHIASASGKRDVLRSLLDLGADPCLRDKAKKVPYNMAPDKETRNVFRSFMKANPDAYDYVAAQIPPPLTEEAEAKQREKAKLKRLAKKEKEKQKKEEDLAKKKDEDDKKRFLALSDREKRALAAERRLLAAKTEAGEAKPVLLRCFACGNDMTGKVPFEYGNYKFCAPKCVSSHRKKMSETKL